MKLKRMVISMVLCLIAVNVYAEIVYLDSGDQKIVQAAVDSASDGDTIFLPEGEWVYKTLRDKTPSVNIVDKDITIIGNGVNKTIITDATGSGFKTNAFRISGTKPARISGLSFRGAVGNNNGIINISGWIKGFRVDHCDFKNVSSGIHIDGAKGLIDNCAFYVTINKAISSIRIFGTNHESWSSPLSLGTDDAVYVEDCTFTYSYGNDSVLQGHFGSRYVFRYNKVTGTVIDAHGACSAGPQKRSAFSYEIYNNIFKSGSDSPRGMYLRGGTGVVYNNKIVGYQSPIHVTNYLICNHAHNICKDWPPCDTYPCPDQIGRSTNQSLEPLYEWNNFDDGMNINILVSNFKNCLNPSVLNVIKEGRDYYNDTVRPGYQAFVYPHPLRGESSPLSGKVPPPSVPGTPSGIQVKAKQ